MYLERFKERDIRYWDRTERRIAAITSQMRWTHAAQIIREAYNDFKRGLNEDSRQVTPFYYYYKSMKYNLANQTTHHHAGGGREKQAQMKLI